MGLPGGARPPGGVRRWTDDAIRATLTQFLGDRRSWPTNREFDEAGLRAFREAVRRYGGPQRWSAEMGVAWVRRWRPAPTPRPSRRVKQPREPKDWPLWTESTIGEALEVFLAGREEWPRFAEFVDTGRKGLYQAVLKHGGTRAWARRMGIKWVTRHGGRSPIWTEARVRESLTEFLGERGQWPSSAEFERENQRPLLNAARRRGGIKRWAAEFGLELPLEFESASGRMRKAWTDELIAATIAPLVTELGRWPTKGEFRRAGLSTAMAAVYEHGGSAKWQSRFGVAARPVDGPVPNRQSWSIAAVDRELRAFCSGRDAWPTEREFQQAGKHGLYRAASRYGGLAHWRARLQLSADRRRTTVR